MGTTGSIIMIVVIIGAFVLMWRSNKKQEREQNDMRNNLEVGDEITTIGGIIGEIVRIKDETVTIETGKDRTKIRILRTAIRSVDVHAADKYGTPAPAVEQPKEAKAKVKATKAKAEEAVEEVKAEETVNEAQETENK